MRIIGGLAAGRLLEVPQGFDVRPMPDKVKLAVFNSLGARPDGARVLDLFAGTGALGLEMLSRGASHLFSVELSERHARCYRKNLQASGLDPAAVELRVQDVFKVLRGLREQGRRFDLIIADPPYGEKNVGRRSTSLAQRLVDDPDLPLLLEPGGRAIIGHARRDRIEIPPHWDDLKQLNHGDTVIRVLGEGGRGKGQVGRGEESREQGAGSGESADGADGADSGGGMGEDPSQPSGN